MSDIFKENIKEWISLDNEIRILSEQVKELRDKRNEIHNDIIRYVETNELENSTEYDGGYSKDTNVVR